MTQTAIIYILTILASIIPTSLIISLNIPKFIFKFSNKLGKTDTICTAVTGILTKEPIRIGTIFFDKHKAVSDLNTAEINNLKLLDPETKLEKTIRNIELQKKSSINFMATATVFCHYQKLQKLEEVLAHFFKSCAIDLKKIKEQYEIITEIPSNEEKKLSTTVIIKNETKEIFAFTKGNPKKILEKCSRVLIDGKKIDIDYQLRHKFKERIEKLNKSGQKVIAFAYKALPIKKLDHYSEHFTENDLVLTGIIGLVETINSDLIPYIEEIKKNNIKICVLTGTKERKAVATAEQLKIINPHHFEAISGKDLEDMNDQKLTKILSSKEKDYIFCELKPADRTRIINTLEQIGNTVAVVNKKQGRGIRELLEAIDKSRKNKKNRKKLISHALNCKLAEVLILIAAIVLRAPLPLSLIMILMVDILFNTILELSINTTKSDDSDIIKQSKIINPQLLINSLITAVILGSIYFWNLIRYGWYPGEKIATGSEAYLKSSTIIFIILSLIQITVSYRAKKIKKIFSNLYLILTTIICLLIINVITSYGLFEKYIGLSRLSLVEWGIVIFAVIIFIIIKEAYELLTNRKSNENTNPESQLSENQSHTQES